MNNNLEDPKILDTTLLFAIDEIVRLYPDAVFGGSIALNAVGLLNRRIGDVDVMIAASKKDSAFALYSALKNETADANLNASDSIMEVNDEPIHHIGGKLCGVSVCLFVIPKLNYSEFRFFNRVIKIQNVNDAILTKQAYASMRTPSSPKHAADVDSIEQALDDLPF